MRSKKKFTMNLLTHLGYDVRMHVHWMSHGRNITRGLNVRRRAYDMHKNLIGILAL